MLFKDVKVDVDFNIDKEINVKEDLEEKKLIKFQKDRYTEIGDNIIKSEKLRAVITKDINNNKPIDEILYTTLECIGNMTGDFTFTRQNIKNLKGRA